MDAKDELLTEVEAAARLGYAPRTLQAWRYTGAGPAFVRLSHTRVRYRVCDLDDWLRARLRRSTREVAA